MISKAVRRLLAVSLAAVMAVGAAGCGNGGTETPDPTKAQIKHRRRHQQRLQRLR